MGIARYPKHLVQTQLNLIQLAPTARMNYMKPRPAAALSNTLQQELRTYLIGRKIRRLRLRKSLRLVDLAAHTSLSPALLSKIESGRIVPTLPTLVRIALVFGVRLDYFFGQDRHGSVSKPAERIRLPETMGGRQPVFTFESLNFHADDSPVLAYLAQFEPGPSKLRLHRHSGFELIFVLSGTLGMVIDGVDYTLASGDALQFDSNLPHGYKRLGDAPCQALVLTSAGASQEILSDAQVPARRGLSLVRRV